jgi:hypothetical protein
MRIYAATLLFFYFILLSSIYSFATPTPTWVAQPNIDGTPLPASTGGATSINFTLPTTNFLGALFCYCWFAASVGEPTPLPTPPAGWTTACSEGGAGGNPPASCACNPTATSGGTVSPSVGPIATSILGIAFAYDWATGVDACNIQYNASLSTSASIPAVPSSGNFLNGNGADTWMAWVGTSDNSLFMSPSLGNLQFGGSSSPYGNGSGQAIIDQHLSSNTQVPTQTITLNSTAVSFSAAMGFTTVPPQPPFTHIIGTIGGGPSANAPELMNIFILSNAINPWGTGPNQPQAPTGPSGSGFNLGVLCRATWGGVGVNLGGTGYGGVEQVKNTFDFTSLDYCQSAAQAAGTPWELEVVAGCYTPSWVVTTDGAPTVNLPSNICAGKGIPGGTDPNSQGTIPILWNSIYLNDLGSLITALGNRYSSGHSAYPPVDIKIEGLTYQSGEIGITKTAADGTVWLNNGYTVNVILGAWKTILADFAATTIPMSGQYLTVSLPNCSSQGCTTGTSTSPLYNYQETHYPNTYLQYNGWGNATYPCGIDPFLTDQLGLINLGVQAAAGNVPSQTGGGIALSMGQALVCAYNLMLQNPTPDALKILEIYNGQAPLL